MHGHGIGTWRHMGGAEGNIACVRFVTRIISSVAQVYNISFLIARLWGRRSAEMMHEAGCHKVGKKDHSVG